ncbi:MAG: hypothetical protein AAF125_26130 [Chloroflexota bacterium]
MDDYRAAILEGLKREKPTLLDIQMARLMREDMASILFAISAYRTSDLVQEGLVTIDDVLKEAEDGLGSIAELLDALIQN